VHTLAVAVGGLIGALARYALASAWPVQPAAMPWSTLVINVSGCLLIGLLLVRLLEAGSAHPLWRPFLGTGVLGGYTTFSTYAVESRTLLADGRIGLAVLYLAGTAVMALLAVQLGVIGGRWLAAARRGGT
jgi:fluoride exporter